MKDGRGDVVRQIAIRTKAPACHFFEVEAQDIALDNFDMAPSGCVILQSRRELWICLDGNHASAASGEQLRHLSVTSAYFDPRFLRAARKRVENAFPPTEVAEEVLPHPLSRH